VLPLLKVSHGASMSVSIAMLCEVVLSTKQVNSGDAKEPRVLLELSC
jgi:hypothetical protein